MFPFQVHEALTALLPLVSLVSTVFPTGFCPLFFVHCFFSFCVDDGPFQPRFHVLNCAAPEQTELRRIFECILSSRVLASNAAAPFDDEIKGMCGAIVLSTVGLYKMVSEGFLPTPTKPVYMFNLRDISKVVEGMVKAKSTEFVSSDLYLQLWVHECQRVFSDRLNTLNDKQKFNQMVDDQMQANLGQSWNDVSERWYMHHI